MKCIKYICLLGLWISSINLVYGSSLRGVFDEDHFINGPTFRYNPAKSAFMLPNAEAYPYFTRADEAGQTMGREIGRERSVSSRWPASVLVIIYDSYHPKRGRSNYGNSALQALRKAYTSNQLVDSCYFMLNIETELSGSSLNSKALAKALRSTGPISTGFGFYNKIAICTFLCPPPEERTHIDSMLRDSVVLAPSVKIFPKNFLNKSTQQFDQRVIDYLNTLSSPS